MHILYDSLLGCPCEYETTLTSLNVNSPLFYYDIPRPLNRLQNLPPLPSSPFHERLTDAIDRDTFNRHSSVYTPDHAFD